WEGNYDLVKLNLHNEDVIQHIFHAVEGWINDFGIDGIRLDVAYCLDREFLRRLREFTDSKKQDFFLLGEVLHGEYGRMLNEMHLHSLTNYQCYKGIYSAINSDNLFEIVHGLLRLFGPEDWCVARGSHLLSFADNHDVSRIASIIKDPALLPAAYGIVFGMPGIPCVYYGSEWGTKADKSQGDPALRPSFEKPEWNALTDTIRGMAEAKKSSKALNYGGFRSILLNNKQCIWERKCDDDRVLIAINIDGAPFTAHFDAGCGMAEEMITGTKHDFGGGSELPPYSVQFWKMER
ncbi:MAG: cyclomaltodextrinase, partial [Lachnospiraceae bacterium]|nr:cyclomaltodextrinase [Lachnospiraceae bacterium]